MTQPAGDRPTERRVLPKALSDQDLMIKLKENAADPRPELFAELVERYKDRIVSYLYRFVGERSAAEDLAQECFVRVFRNIASYDPTAKFSTWIYTIATNLAKDEFKRRARHPVKSLDWSSGGGSDTTRDLPGRTGSTTKQPEIIAEKQELRSRIQAALHLLRDDDREILILREMQQMPYEEIARILGIPMGTVKSRISRARTAFADVWKDTGASGSIGTNREP